MSVLARLDASWLAFVAAGYTVPASWTPPAGEPLPAQVMFDTPGETVLGDVSTNDRAIRYRAADWPGLQAGMTVTVDGISCRVRSVLPIDDGMTLRAEIVRF
jgi:hypothetical protein